MAHDGRPFADAARILFTMKEHSVAHTRPVNGRRGPPDAPSIVAAGVPFAFALIRAVTTGTDLRYFWVALASLVGAVATVAAVRAYDRPVATIALASALFIVATFFAVAAAVLIGTVLGLGILVVGAAFGFWFTVAGLLYLRARARAHR
jgi:hypothetical protein